MEAYDEIPFFTSCSMNPQYFFFTYWLKKYYFYFGLARNIVYYDVWIEVKSRIIAI